MKKNVFFSVMCMLLCACMVSCFGGSEVKETPVSFETMVVKKETREMNLVYAAKIKGKQDVDVQSRIDGQIISIAVTDGQKVNRGQVLFCIDSRVYEADLKSAEANVLTAKGNEAQAKLQYESNKELFDKHIVSDYVLKNSQIAYQNAQAQVKLAEAQVAQAKVTLSYCTVTAPVSGVIGTISYRVGDQTGPSSTTPFTTISDNSTVTADFSIDEATLIEIKDEFDAGNSDFAAIVRKYSPAVELQLKNGSIYDQKGKIKSVSGVVDMMTGAVACRAEFPNPDGQLNSGISGSVLYPVKYEDIIVVPQAATVKLQDKVLVYLVTKEGKAKAMVVEVAPQSNGKEYIVTGGLKEGDEIVSVGASNVQDGQVVKFRTDPK